MTHSFRAVSLASYCPKRVGLTMPEKKLHIDRFRSLYQRKTGQGLTDDDAELYFDTLVRLVAAIYER